MSAGCSIVNALDCELTARLVQEFLDTPIGDFPPPARIVEGVTCYVRYHTQEKSQGKRSA